MRRPQSESSIQSSLPSCEMWCVLGTLGSLLKEAPFSEASLVFRFLFSLPDLLSLREVDAVTDWPVEMSLDSLSDREGLEEE